MVKQMLGPIDSQRGLTQVMEPSSGWMPGALQTIKACIEQACLEEAGCRFTQEQCTPILQPPLLEDFGEIGVGRLAFQAVLNSTYVPPLAVH